MGYNLKRLMNQYGVSTASKAGYAGASDPGAAPEMSFYPAVMYPEGTPDPYAEQKAKEAKAFADWMAKNEAYTADKSAYDAYSGSYDQRMQGTPMYAAKQFQTQKQVQPENFDQLFDKYLNSNSTAEQAMAGAAAISPYMKIDMDGNDGIQLTNPQAARNAFIQGIGPTLGTGMGNTGNQAIMEQSGKYYGNVLMNPIYSSSLGIEAVDGDGEVIDTGTGVKEEGGGDFILFDGSETVDNSSDNGNSSLDDFMTAHNTRVAADIEAAGGEKGDTSVLGSVFSGGGDDGIGEWGAVGDFFGGIGDALNITNYDGSIDGQPSGNDGGIGFSSSDDDDDDDGGWSWSDSSWNPSNWQEGGSVKGYATAGLVEDETIETITNVPSLDELVNQQIATGNQSNDNIAELRMMLAESAVPSSQNAGTIRGQLGAARQEFMDLVTAQADSAGTGPSESEKWFRLAAAFGKPTQSGHFMENLGLANEAMAGVASERRAAKTNAAGLKLRGAEMNIDFLKEDLAAATAAGAAERDWKRGMASELLQFEQEQAQKAEQRQFDLDVIAGNRAYEDGKPKSAAAKIATDMGLEGTEYNAFIKEYYENEQLMAKLEFDAMQRNVNKLSSGELNLKADTESQIDAADSSLALLEQAMEINALAFDKSLMGSAKTSFLGGMDPTNPRYIATMELEQILSSNALASLKATFGGAISDGERRALSDLQGSKGKSAAERAKIFQNSARALASIRARRAAKLKKISSGEYGQITPGDE